jgi:hypothetical protein
MRNAAASAHRFALRRMAHLSVTGPALENRVKGKVGDDFEDFKS